VLAYVWVDDVSRLIDGLNSGKISAEYVDKRIKEKEAFEAEVVVKEKKKVEDAEAKKYDNLPDEKKKEIKVKVRGMEAVRGREAGWNVKRHPLSNNARASQPGLRALHTHYLHPDHRHSSTPR
jgi:hypothetical protein